MKGKAEAPATVAEYVARQDRKTQAILRKLRAVIMKNAPGAEERISYQMPAYFMNGVLVYYAAWEKHIGLYPGAQAIVDFEGELTKYVHAKGSIQFPLDRPMPFGLIARIVKYRVTQKGESTNAQKGVTKGTKKTTGGDAKKSTVRGKR
jgi:uncharacterized protein YdhG (YjbR/CyaY superfamily)